MRKVSCDLADGGEYAEGFGLSTLIGTICGNYLSNKIVNKIVKNNCNPDTSKYDCRIIRVVEVLIQTAQ
jgi:hypothetical protein